MAVRRVSQNPRLKAWLIGLALSRALKRAATPRLHGSLLASSEASCYPKSETTDFFSVLFSPQTVGVQSGGRELATCLRGFVENL